MEKLKRAYGEEYNTYYELQHEIFADLCIFTRSLKEDYQTALEEGHDGMAGNAYLLLEDMKSIMDNLHKWFHNYELASGILYKEIENGKAD